MAIEDIFRDDIFEIYKFENIPLERDLFMVDSKLMEKWARSVVKSTGEESEVLVGSVSAEKIHANSVELRLFVNVFSRYHAVSMHLPRDKFVACVGAIMADEVTHLFVDGDWLDNLYRRAYAVFGMVDAIHAKEAMRAGKLERAKLQSLRNGLDLLAAKYPEIAFISFADSVLLKSIWSTSYVRDGFPQTYRPELMIEVFDAIKKLYQTELGLDAYGIFAQGVNEFYEDELLHVSGPKNHVGLNSVGAPFAQILEIEAAVKRAIKKGDHPAVDLYLDEHFFASLKMTDYKFKEKVAIASYNSKVMESGGEYRYILSSTLKPMLAPAN